MNGFNNINYNGSNWRNVGMGPQAFPMQLSNIIFVTSLEEALYRTNDRGSDMMYVHQTKPVFYRVKVNSEGQKTWAEYPYVVPNQDDNTPITRAELKALEDKLEELKKRINPEVNNEQSNG